MKVTVYRHKLEFRPDLQRILRQTYDSAALTPDLRRACELRAINKQESRAVAGNPRDAAVIFDP